MSRASAAVLFPDGMTAVESPAHHPLLYSAGRHGCWGFCTCGRWASGTWTTLSGVHGEFGRHLLAAAGQPSAPSSTSSDIHGGATSMSNEINSTAPSAAN